MRLMEYEAHNIMRVSDVKFDLAGRHLFLIGGKNGQGKTSAITALLMALCGRSGMDYPDISLKDGEDRGWVKVKLSGDDELHEPEGITVELFLRRKLGGQVVEEFRVLDSAGDEAPEPRTLLKRLCEMRGFDPLSFERMDKKAKRELLAKLLGLDFTAEKAAYQKAYNERTQVGNEGKKLKAACDSMPSYPDAPKEEIQVADLMAELERRQYANAANEAERKKLAGLAEAKKKANDACLESRRKIVELQAALVKATEDAKSLEVEFDKADCALTDQEAAVVKLQDADESEVRQQIKASGDINAKVRANAAKAAKAAEVESKRAEYDALQKRLEEIKDGMQQRLQSAPWPVPGLSMDDDGVILDGLPIEQACKSRRIDVSVEIGMALNPKLRLLVCEDGNDLDYESLDRIGQKLIDRDYQMLVEFVTRNEEDESRCAVIIRDGEVLEPSEV